MARPTEAEAYWTDEFEVTNDDLEYLFNLFLETETPLGLRDLTLKLIQYRLDSEQDRVRKQIEQGDLYQPRVDYQVGQKVVFPAFDYQVGEVVARRPGRNAEYGEFNVIDVTFANGKARQFAAALKIPHPLNIDLDKQPASAMDAQHVMRNYGRAIARKLRARFGEEKDLVNLAGRWFLKSLLVDVEIGHLHLAEAVLDTFDGGPLSTEQIYDQIKEIWTDGDVNPRLRLFSLDYALQRDARFDEVGPAGQVLWFLHQYEPEAVKKVPLQLQYDPIPYSNVNLTDELNEIVLEIDDELSPIELDEEDEDEVTITLTYPYRRTGTLPLTARLQYLFPTAFETTRIKMTLVDAQSDQEVPGWVVRAQGYVYGLEEFYRKYQIPIGAYVTVRRHDDPSKLLVDFFSRRSRTEWIRLAVPEGNLLKFENHRRSIGAEYDDLMIFGIEDLAGIDALWQKYRSLPLVEILRRLLPELARLSPQQSVHVKTLYSAVNLVRRCPPSPIFATLVDNPVDFEHVGGPYWRLA
jgi:hypothetical protein